MEIEAFDKFWKLINEKLSTWVEAGISHLPNMIVAIVIALIFAFIARVSSSALKRVLYRTLESKQIADLLSAIFKILVLAAGIFIALDFLGLRGTVTSLLAGAGIIGLAIGFAFQDMTENLIAGMTMGVRKPFQIGDIIKSDDVFGKVERINLRNTLIETFYGQLTIVPNKTLFQNVLVNYSHYGVRRIEVPVGISYADDPEKAEKILVDGLNSLDFVVRKEETAVYAESFGDSSVNLLVWFWIDYPGETGFMQARHTAVCKIKSILEENDILIPFPIRTIDFGAKGGRELDGILNDYQKENRNQSQSSNKDDAPETSANDAEGDDSEAAE
ncbi:mechanosensitive ion channel family protein [Aestuariibacter sp. AA17]|uniref:Small-conductance mechanosensitive channel n=1 Tax=Fluctibacter corallii TaxID=2984329 RepID=A0ABT3A5C0_9ALTE|nr:mechanosensitive ion channel family protein [Aestuariibacter sp. AA17]MCV2883835.1 mechanosensitive ion channel family protein [Aestuariibacter sp. AA17]